MTSKAPLPAHHPRPEWRRLYKTPQWQAIRQARLLASPMCRYCAEEGKERWGTEVNHIIPHKGDPQLFFDFDNTETACKPHHDRHIQSAEKGLGIVRGADAQGWPLDRRHPWNAKTGKAR